MIESLIEISLAATLLYLFGLIAYLVGVAVVAVGEWFRPYHPTERLDISDYLRNIEPTKTPFMEHGLKPKRKRRAAEAGSYRKRKK